VVVLAGLAAGCELVAGIQDKYLATADGSGIGIRPSESGIAAGDDGSNPVVAREDATVAQSEDAAPMADVASPMGEPQDAGPTVPDAMATGGGNDTPPDAGKTDPSAPCSGQPSFLFCDDFDTETMVAQGWQWSLSSIDGGSSAFFAGAYTSPPRSVQIIAPPALSPHNQVLGLDLGSLTSQVRLAFDLRIDMDSLTSLPDHTAIAQILGARQGTGLELDYLLRPNQGAQLTAFVSQDGGPAVNLTLPSPPLRTWTRIVIAYDASAGVTVYEDGQPIGTNAVTGGAPNDTKVQVGMIYQVNTGSATLQMEMDNIVVRGH
jgi:hypothetical protein